MDESQLAGLYQEYLGRAPDESGIATWSGQSPEDVIAGITSSQEYANRTGGGDAGGGGGGGQDINSIYQQYLGRDVDPSGAQTYAGWNPQDIIGAIQGSQEYANRGGDAGYTGGGLPGQFQGGSLPGQAEPGNLPGQDSSAIPTNSSEYVNKLYQDVFGRAADAGAQNWINALESGQMSAQDVANSFVNSQEAQQNKTPQTEEQRIADAIASGYGSTALTPGQAPKINAEAEIADIYQKVLGRAPDAGAKEWIDALNTGTVTPIDITNQIAASKEAQQRANTAFGGTDPNNISSDVYQLYSSALGRAPTAEELAANVSALYKDPDAFAWMTRQLTDSAEGQARAAKYGIDPETQYQNLAGSWKYYTPTPEQGGIGGFFQKVGPYMPLAAAALMTAGASGALGAGAGATGAGGAFIPAAGSGASFALPSMGSTALNAILAGAGKGALTGAAMGGISSGIQGGNIGQGILRGGLTGAVGGGIGGGFGGGAMGNIIGGVGSGAAGAALSGGDVGRGALMGGASGLLNYGANQIPGLQSTPGQFGIGDVARGAITGGALSSVMGGNFGKGAIGGVGGAYLSNAISPYINSAYNQAFGSPKTIDVTANQPVSSFYPEGSGLAGNGAYLPMPAAPMTTSDLTTQDIALQYASMTPEQQSTFDTWKEASYNNPDFQRIDPTSGFTVTGPSVKDMEAAIAVLTGSGNAMAADTTQTAPTGEKVSIPISGAPSFAGINEKQLNPDIAKAMAEKDYRLATVEESGIKSGDVKSTDAGSYNPKTGASYSQEANAWVIPNNPKPFSAEQSVAAPENSNIISPTFLSTEKSDMLAGDLGPKGYVKGEAYTELEIIDPKTDQPVTADLPKSVTDQPDPKMATPTKELDPSKVDKENTAKVEKKNADGSAVVKNSITGEKSTVYLNGEADVGDNVQVTSIRTTSPTTDYNVSSQAGGAGVDQGVDKEQAEKALSEQIATQVAIDNLIGEGEGAGGAGGGGGGGGGGGAGGGGGGGGGGTTGGGKPSGGAPYKLPIAAGGKGNIINLPGITNLSPGMTAGDTSYELAGRATFAAGGSAISGNSGAGSMGSSPLDKYLARLSPGLTEGATDYQLPGYFADGGQVEEHNPQFFSEGGLGSLKNRYVKGDGDGTSDSIPAMLANGEFVIPADVVSSLGNGSNDSGAHLLDEFLSTIRKHKRAADAKQLPPDSKGALGYLLEAKKKVKK